MDKFLSRTSHIAQIVLVCVAVFGYFYTVIPVYQKELLSEEIAQREIELNKLKKDAEHLPIKIQKLEAVANKLKTQTEGLETEKVYLEKSISETSEKLKRTISSGNTVYKEIYIENIKNGLGRKYFIHSSNNDSYSLLRDNSKYNYDDFFLTPYRAIKDILIEEPEVIKSVNLVPEEIKLKINSEIIKKLKINKNELSKPESDIREIVKNFHQELKENNIKISKNNDFNSKDYDHDEFILTRNIEKKYVEIINNYHKIEMDRCFDFFDSL